MHFRNFFHFDWLTFANIFIIEQLTSNNSDMKQPIKPQIRAVLLIREPLILEHFVIDIIDVIKCLFSTRKSRVNIIC